METPDGGGYLRAPGVSGANRTFKPRIRAPRLQATASTVPVFSRFPAIVVRPQSSDRSQHRFRQRFPWLTAAFPHPGRTQAARIHTAGRFALEASPVSFSVSELLFGSLLPLTRRPPQSKPPLTNPQIDAVRSIAPPPSQRLERFSVALTPHGGGRVSIKAGGGRPGERRGSQ